MFGCDNVCVLCFFTADDGRIGIRPRPMSQVLQKVKLRLLLQSQLTKVSMTIDGRIGEILRQTVSEKHAQSILT